MEFAASLTYSTQLAALPSTRPHAAQPVFSVRGLQPFHDFAEGPDWWNEQDYKSIIHQIAKMQMNFIGLHTYPFSDSLVCRGREWDVVHQSNSPRYF